MIQRIALYTALGLVLNSAALDLMTWQFWAVAALFWATEHMTRTDLIAELNRQLQAMRTEHNNKDTQ
jgi:hypothetical protein